MKVNFNRLDPCLKGALASIYLIVGEEPWQRMAAADAIRARARREGYAAEPFFYEAGFDMGELRKAAQTGSLFGGDRRLLDVRVEVKMPAALTDFVQSFRQDPPDDAVLLVQSPKATANSAWVRKFASHDNTVVVAVYNKSGAEFRKWLHSYIAREKMVFEPQAEELLLARIDGNMLAAANAIAKISLSCAVDGSIGVDEVAAAIGDGSRFDVYDLADAAISADLTRAVRILHGLKSGNAPLPLVLWALAHRIRQLVSSQKPAPYGMPGARRAMQRALARKKVSWKRLLHRCAAVDEVVKSADTAQAWNAVFDLTLHVCGHMGERRK